MCGGEGPRGAESTLGETAFVTLLCPQWLLSLIFSDSPNEKNSVLLSIYRHLYLHGSGVSSSVLDDLLTESDSLCKLPAPQSLLSHKLPALLASASSHGGPCVPTCVAILGMSEA